MEGKQRRGTGGVDHVARPLRVKHVGHPVCEDAQGVAGHEPRIHRPRVACQRVAVVEPRGADEHPRARPRELRGHQPRHLDGLPGHLQQQALLGVHLRRLAWGDTEKPCVEGKGIVEQPGHGTVGRADGTAVGVPEAGGRPARLGNRPDGAATRDQHGPESGTVLGTRQAATVADQGNLRDGHSAVNHAQTSCLKPLLLDSCRIATIPWVVQPKCFRHTRRQPCRADGGCPQRDPAPCQASARPPPVSDHAP